MKKTSPFSGGAIYVLLGAMLWGTTGTSQALAPEGAGPLSVGALRIAIGGAALLAIALARGSFAGTSPWPLLPTAAAVVSMAAYQPLFFTGAAMTGVAVGTLVTLDSCPVITGVLAYAFFRERPGGRWYVSSAMALAGCTLLILSGGEAEASDPVGMLFSLGAGFSYSVFVLSSKRLLMERGADAVNGLVFSAAGLLLLPALLAYPPSWLLQLRGILVAAHLGLVATALAYFLFLKGLSAIPASTGVTLTMAEPLTASLLGVFLLGERLGGTGAAGAAMLFLGLAFLAAGKNKED